MSLPSRLCFALLATLIPFAHGEAKERSRYLDPATVDLRQILSGPPAESVTISGGEGDTVLARQQAATPADRARAAREVDLKPTIFADILGPDFTKKEFPKTARLLRNAERDLHAVSAPAKQLWGRPRPPLQDPRIHPTEPLPKSDSYPSSHAARGELWGGILARLLPACAASLQLRGQQIGDDRVMSGVHFPSDVAAGRQLADAVLARFTQSPAFMRDLKTAEREISQQADHGDRLDTRCGR